MQVLYREDFEKNKGKGFSVVADTPELQRMKKTQDQISNVSVNNTLTEMFTTHTTCSVVTEKHNEYSELL